MAVLVAVIVLANAAGSGMQAEAAESPENPREFDLKSRAALLAENQGITVEDASQALVDSGVLGPFTGSNWGSRDVGPVWVTYRDGYQVHAGIIKGQDPSVIAELEKRLGHEIIRHDGAASLGELTDAAELLTREHPEVWFNVNFISGNLEVNRPVDLPSETISTQYVVETFSPPEPADPMYAGDNWQVWNGSSYVNNCSIGFYTVSGPSTWIATAAHCANNYRRAYSPTAGILGYGDFASFYEDCGLDLQYQSYNGPATTKLQSNQASQGYFSAPLDQSTPGVYIGQPMYRWGQTTGVVAGAIANFGTQFTGPSTDCPGGSSFTGIWHTASACPGDSGGPVTPMQGWSFTLAGITSGGICGTGGGGNAAWIPYINPPYGVICLQFSNPPGCQDI